MSEYGNTNRGVLFTNDRKERDSHPDLKGRINISGTDYWLSGWWKQGQRGEFLSLSLGEQCHQQQQQAAPQRSARPPSQRQQPTQQANQGVKVGAGFDDMTDDIPF